MKKVLTDNSNLKQKTYIRKTLINNIKKNKINILNCFAGKLEIYKNINSKKINLINIDKKNLYLLKGDNRKFLMSLNLNEYDIIDLDAYGIPFKQLEIIFSKKYNGYIVFTFIQSMFGYLPKLMLNKIGYTNNMIKKIPTLFNQKGYEKFLNYLTLNGIKNIIYYKDHKKYYGYFKSCIGD